MKTSVIMIRKMGDFEVHQRTKDGFFNATTLLNQWNKQSGMKKEIKDYLNNKSTKEFIQTMIEDESIMGGITPIITTRGKNGGTQMHPYVFMDYAMWINPKFKLVVIKFVYDQLIKQRHHAGDDYVKLSASGKSLDGYNYPQVATAMNWIVFGQKGKQQRQKATQDELMELSQIQTQLSFAIDMGYIKTMSELIKEMRKMWKIKQNKTPF